MLFDPYAYDLARPALSTASAAEARAVLWHGLMEAAKARSPSGNKRPRRAARFDVPRTARGQATL